MGGAEHGLRHHTPHVAGGLHIATVEVPADVVDQAEEAVAAFWPLDEGAAPGLQFHRSWWDALVQVDDLFAQAVAKQAAPAATVWVQGHDLPLLPGSLRRIRPDLRIACFSHLPFPSHEAFSRIPWRRQIVHGLFGADLLAVQTPDDVENVQRAADRCGLAIVPPGTLPDNCGGAVVSSPRRRRLVRIGAFPLSPNAATFARTARQDRVIARAEKIRRELGQPEVILLGVDRLHRANGIPHKLWAVDALYRQGRLQAPEVALVQVVSPDGHRADDQQPLRDEVETIIARMNGTHARLSRAPVHYLRRRLPRDELTALYLAADVLLVTAVRGESDPVATEYVASHHDERGAVVLSTFSREAADLPEACLTNPHDVEGLRDAVVRAVRMPPSEAAQRMRAMRARVLGRDPGRWTREVLDALAISPSAGGRPA